MSTFQGFRGNTLLLVQEDKRVKAGCCTFDISSDGDVLATKHPSGYHIPFMQGCRTSNVQFMPCTNVIKTPSWPLVFTSFEQDFHKMQPGSLRNVFVIIICGLITDGREKGCLGNIHFAITIQEGSFGLCLAHISFSS
jgi:hypothetical protein